MYLLQQGSNLSDIFQRLYLPLALIWLMNKSTWDRNESGETSQTVAAGSQVSSCFRSSAPTLALLTKYVHASTYKHSVTLHHGL